MDLFEEGSRIRIKIQTCFIIQTSIVSLAIFSAIPSIGKKRKTRQYALSGFEKILIHLIDLLSYTVSRADGAVCTVDGRVSIFVALVRKPLRASFADSKKVFVMPPLLVCSNLVMGSFRNRGRKAVCYCSSVRNSSGLVAVH